MDIEETMVEQNVDDVAADDALPEDIVEETDESEVGIEELTDVEGSDDDAEPAEEKPEKGSKGTSEPGWIKKRVQSAVDKAIAQTRAEMQAMFDQQMAPIRARMMEDEAQALVRSKKVGDIETARELVRLRNGMPQQETSKEAPRQQQPRQANGQYAQKSDPATEARIDMLKHQADYIKRTGGPDVIKEFQTNEEIKQKVIRGEMDLYEVADYMKSQKTKQKVPAPTRSPNGASGTNPNAIDTMSDEQFEKMERRIKEGARIRLS